MKLQYIKTNACPICGCTEVVGEGVNTTGFNNNRRIRVHANGGRWESREFLCGNRVHYIPNYDKEEFDGDCDFDLEAIKRKEKRKSDKEKLLKYCEENDISPDLISYFGIDR